MQIFIEAFHEDIGYQPSFEESQEVPLGITILILKFPDWLPNADYSSTYQRFVSGLEELGLQTNGSCMRETKTHIDLDRAGLIREAIKNLDLICETARNLVEKKAD